MCMHALVEVVGKGVKLWCAVVAIVVKCFVCKAIISLSLSLLPAFSSGSQDSCMCQVVTSWMLVACWPPE